MLVSVCVQCEIEGRSERGASLKTLKSRDMTSLRRLSGFYGRLPANEKGNFSISLHSPTIGEHNRPRTRSTVTIWHLPDSVLVNLLKGIHIKDLLSFRLAHPHFRNIVDSNTTLWTNASFAEVWPAKVSAWLFDRAFKCGNIEATIKLAVSCLYREGLTKDDVSKVGQEAARYLCQAEALTPTTFPFFWIFIRPPWAPKGSCCKVQAFQCIKEELADGTCNKDLAFGVALTMKLKRLSLHGVDKEDEKKYFKMAMDMRSAPAIFFSLLDDIPDETDTAKELERVRLLRHLAAANLLEAKLTLVKGYIQGQYGGLLENLAKEYVHDFFASSKPSKIHLVFSEGLTSDISRYILVDWLVEVVGMKDFSAHTLYLAVSMFDRFLKVRNVQRSQVQLVGVAAMVISSRFLGFDILTIREAAWLTDDSYSYHDVVKMMGELVAAVKGNIRVLTIQDYVKVLISMAGESGYVAMLVEYIAMLCLLQSEMGQYSPAEIASSCLLLSRLLMNKENPWPKELRDWTGFSQEYLGLCAFHIHKKCLLEGAEVDYRDRKLKAVKMRYSEFNRFSVSNVEIIGHRELCRRLGVTQFINHGKNTKAIRFRNTDELIVSPQRGRKTLQSSYDGSIVDRKCTATPPIKADCAFEECVSGYEGDLEEDDSEESSCDTFDHMFDLNESFMSDPSEDSREWDSEQSLMEDQSVDEGYADLDSSATSASSPDSISENNESSFACLSSLCQFGNNVNCRALGYSPSRCISNCSCQQSNIPTDPSSCEAYPGRDQRSAFMSSGSLHKSSSSLSSSSSFRPSVLPHSAKEKPSKFRILNPDSVFSGVSSRSSDVANSSLSCDTQGSVHHKNCDIHSGILIYGDHRHSHPSNPHIKSSGFKGTCNKTANINQVISDAVVSNPSELRRLLSSQPIRCSSECGSLVNDIVVPRKSKRLTSTPRNSFTRLTSDERINLTHHNSPFLSSTPSNFFMSKFSNGHLSQSYPEFHVPSTAKATLNSDKFLHRHFTRSNSAFKIASSPSSTDNQLRQSQPDLYACHSKKGKFEKSRLSMKSFIARDRGLGAMKCSTDTVRDCDSLDCQEMVQCELVVKRKRKF